MLHSHSRWAALLSRSLSDLFALKRSWAKARGVISRTIEDDSFAAFVTELVCREAGPACRVSTLFLDGAPIAVELGFVCGGALFLLRRRLRSELSRLLAGTLQLEHTLEACFAEGITAFDLLPPNDEYKSQWANSQETRRQSCAALTALGVLQAEAARIDVAGLAKASLRRLPKPARQAVHGLAAKWMKARDGKASRPRSFAAWNGAEWSLVALACAAFAVIAD